jgi:hypothetical protein
MKYTKKRCIRLATASDKVYQLLARGRWLMNKPKLSEKKMSSVKFDRNLRRNIFYGIYFNKFHAICKGKFQKCDH